MQTELSKEPLFAGLSAGRLRYQACILQINGNLVKSVKHYSAAKERTTWTDFVQKIKQDFPDHLLVTALGFDDSCVGFYHFEIPTVTEKQLSAVIASQAEIHLPLPIEQMQYSWQTIGQNEGRRTAVVAAAKRDMLLETVNQARQINADAIVLGSEAVLRAICFFSDDLGKDFSLLQISQSDAKLFFVRKGILTKVTKFDCEFPAIHDEHLSEIALLCLDIQSVIDEDVMQQGQSWPFYLDGQDRLTETVEKALNDRGVEARRLRYDMDRLCEAESPEWSLECAGLALIAHDANQQYDLFETLHHKINSGQKQTTGQKKKILAVASLLLAIFIAASYGVDKHLLSVYKKQMDTTEFSRLVETHRLRSVIAQQRMDISGLIEKINQSIPQGVTVQSLAVQRFQKIAVGGVCKEPKMMYAFAEALGKCRGIESVRITKQDIDQKKGQTTFAMTFDYGNFTDRRKMLE